ncbi:MAG: ABC transporter permease [Rhodospirillales bacterium]|jgi:spermidine/putrescine transport system permease protein|nr:ABC transporter permease [Rhodospirillales bacterium]MBT4041419.1 ABC transporter permease [Rhodospirillales bacterium]MBT4628284.1 ABC transporter permease [Rhodospirillales bacterium]MBT5352298.1 ABC transporter permease [Rhodospirillales bacterium]MBT5521053.1 ABC transporter permease [Rhodospirillales bacterium]
MSTWLPKSASSRRWLGLAPSYIVIGIFMLIPMVIMGVFSFLEPNPYGGVKAVGSFDAYVKLFFEYDLEDQLVFNPGYINIVWRSFQLSIMATVLCLVVGFPVAYYITLQPENKRNFYIYLVTIPFWTNLLIRTFAWIIILGRGGVIELPLQKLGIIDDSLRMMYSDGAIAVGLTYSYLPLMVLPIYASLEKLDFRLLEAASDLYANRWVTMWKVVIPLCKPGVVAGCILVFIPCIGAFIAPNLLGGGKKLMLGSLVQFQFSSARNWPFGAALSMLLLSAVVVSLIFYARAAKKRALMEGEV